MNPYDNLHYDVTQYEFDELALKYIAKMKQRTIAAKLLIILSGMLAICGLIVLDAAWSICLILLSVLLLIIIWQRYLGAHASSKLYRTSLKAYRDYIYFYYRRTKKTGLSGVLSASAG